MYKKITKITAVIFILATMCSLALPLFYTYVDGAVGYHMTVQIYNVAEFSPWGGMVIFLPIILLGTLCSNFSNKVKIIMIMVVFLLCMVSSYNATVATHTWVCNHATGDIRSYGTIIIYAMLFFMSSLLSYMYCNQSQKKQRCPHCLR